MTLSFSDQCRNRMARQNASCYIFPDGIEIYKVDGEYFTRKEFNETFPINLRLRNANDRSKGSNIDGRKKFLE